MNKKSQKKILKGFYDEAGKHRSGFYNRPGGYEERFQKLLVRFVVNALNKRGLLVDVGCGRGKYLAPLLERGFTYVGLDSSKEMLKAAKSNADPRGRSDFFLVQGDFEYLPFACASFDSVMCIGVFQLITRKDSRKKVVRELIRTLRPNGEILIEIKNKLNFIYGWVLRKTNRPELVQPITPLEMKLYLKTFGCDNVHFMGVMFPSPWLSPLVIIKASRQDRKKDRPDE